ncbi:hypothetical protein [Polaromonas sp.]|uniref:hypothetical protein n=1 Tax=Polaromonas sp. TaxID=1869339 RepID=UPI003BB68CAC
MKIPLDKQLHFFSGMALAGLVSPFGLLMAALAVLVAAVGKEVRDSLGYGTLDAWDAGATIFGGALMLAWLELARRFL